MSEHDGLLDRALGNSDGQINQQELPPAELALNHQAKAPQEDHVANQMSRPHVDKVAGDPLNGMQAIAVSKSPRAPLAEILHESPAGEEKNQAVHNDHRDRRERKMVDRCVGVKGNQHPK